MFKLNIFVEKPHTMVRKYFDFPRDFIIVHIYLINRLFRFNIMPKVNKHFYLISENKIIVIYYVPEKYKNNYVKIFFFY